MSFFSLTGRQFCRVERGRECLPDRSVTYIVLLLLPYRVCSTQTSSCAADTINKLHNSRKHYNFLNLNTDFIDLFFYFSSKTNCSKVKTNLQTKSSSFRWEAPISEDIKPDFRFSEVKDTKVLCAPYTDLQSATHWPGGSLSYLWVVHRRNLRKAN